MEQLLTVMILTAVIITAIGLVVSVSNPLIESSKETASMRDAEYLIKLIDDSVREVVKEGTNSRRMLNIRSAGEVETLPEEDAIQIGFSSRAGLADYLTRLLKGNILFIAGNDVSCSNLTNITMENTFINVTFKKTQRTSPLAQINTTENIVSMHEKTGNTRVSFVNSSIIINDNQSTSRGTGYSELLRSGKSMPSCTTHFFVNNSAIEYDIYYTLYAGADFLTIDVRSVLER
ncbi:MAG: hypothetical protein J4469_05210 [Candidatus Aenigmarchaeota archaeon]|nr:hypothetical protein [Candidatus Aenigmarchaeota archaeon]